MAAGADLVRLTLERSGRFRLRARGSSMRPALHDGDVVTLVTVAAAAIAVGDVVCYEPAPGRLALHRVVARDATHVVTKGDALDWVERVDLGRVLGKVTAVEPRGRLGRIVTALGHLADRLRHVGSGRARA